MRIELKLMVMRFAAWVVCAMLMVQGVCFAGNGVVDLSPNREGLEKRYEELSGDSDLSGIFFEGLLDDVINRKMYYSNKGSSKYNRKLRKLIEENGQVSQITFLVLVELSIKLQLKYKTKSSSMEHVLREDKTTNGGSHIMGAAILNALDILDNWREKDFLIHVEDGDGKDITGRMTNHYLWYIGKLGERLPYDATYLLRLCCVDTWDALAGHIVKTYGGKVHGKHGYLNYTLGNSYLGILAGVANGDDYGVHVWIPFLTREEMEGICYKDLLDRATEIEEIINREREFRGIE